MTAQAGTPGNRIYLEQMITRPPRSLWSDAWHRLLRNKAAVAGAIIIVIFALVAIFAPVLAPHSPLQIYDGQKYLPPAWEESGPWPFRLPAARGPGTRRDRSPRSSRAGC